MLAVPPDFPEFGVFVGPEGIRELMMRFLDQWERLTLEATNLRAAGDTVIARVLQHAKGRSSGIEGDLEYFMLFTFRGSKIVRIETVMEEADALEAVGLKDNVEIARRAVEAAVGPNPDFATINALYHPAHELHSAIDIGGQARTGAHGFREWRAEIDETLQSWELAIEEATAIDDDRVLLVWTATVVGKRSGASAAQHGVAVMTLRNGKVTRTESYSTREQALEAASNAEAAP